jgi:hypothetical protein
LTKKITYKAGDSKYIVDTNEMIESEEITCPLDSGMKIQKKDGCVIIKKLARLKPF